MTATTYRAEAADGIFAHMDVLARERSQLIAARDRASSRRQKRRIGRRLREINQADDECQAEYEAWVGTSDEEWGGL